MPNFRNAALPKNFPKKPLCQSTVWITVDPRETPLLDRDRSNSTHSAPGIATFHSDTTVTLLDDVPYWQPSPKVLLRHQKWMPSVPKKGLSVQQQLEPGV